MRALAEILLLFWAAGCASREELASRVQSAMTPDRLAPVVACWEAEFESSGFTARYVAVLDMRLERDGTLSDVSVRRVYDEGEGKTPSPANSSSEASSQFARCLEEGLERASLTFRPDAPIQVEGFHLAFDDGSRQARQAASERTPHLLIGPRADRCKGLYAYEPPRDITVVEAALAEAEVAADRAADEDALARALQQSYDLALELRARLELDLEREDLAPPNRKRLEEQRERARRMARETGARIGCR